MGSGCTRVSASTTLRPVKRVSPFVLEAEEALDSIEKWDIGGVAGGLQHLNALIEECLRRIEQVSSEGLDEDARSLEWRVVHCSWAALERSIPSVRSSLCESPSQNLAKNPSGAIRVADEASAVISKLFGVAAQLQEDGDDARAIAVLVRLARLEIRTVFALVEDALSSDPSHRRLFNLARDRLLAVIDVNGIAGIANQLASRLLLEQDRVETFAPFVQHSDPEMFTSELGYLSGLCGLFDILSNVADEEILEVTGDDAASEDADEPSTADCSDDFTKSVSVDISQPVDMYAQLEARSLHAVALHRLALGTLRTVLEGFSSDWRIFEAHASLSDLQRASQFGSLIPLDPKGAPTCVSWLILSVCPAACVNGVDPQLGPLSRRWLRFCLEHQQAALATAPYLSSFDVVTPLLDLMAERFAEAFVAEEWFKVGGWVLLASGLEVNIREILGVIRARKFSEWLLRTKVAESAFVPVIRSTIAWLESAPSSADLKDADADTPSPVYECCCACGTGLFFYAAAMRGTFGLSERTCPHCGSVRSLDECEQPARGLKALAYAWIPADAQAIELYSVFCSSSAIAVNEASVSPMGESPAVKDCMAKRRDDSTSVHVDFQAALRRRLTDLRKKSSDTACSPDDRALPLLFVSFALYCGIAFDLGSTLLQLEAERGGAPRVEQPFADELDIALQDPATRASIEHGSLAYHDLQEWCDTAMSRSSRSDTNALRESLVWACTHPYAQGCDEYAVVVKAYCTVCGIPETWALHEILGSAEAVQPWRKDMRSNILRGDLVKLRCLLEDVTQQPLLADLPDCSRGVQAYCAGHGLPLTWNVTDVLTFDQAAFQLRQELEHACDSEDRFGLAEVLENAARSKQLTALEDVSKALDTYRTLLKLPKTWDLECCLKQGEAFASWRDSLSLAMEPVKAAVERARSAKQALERSRSTKRKRKCHRKIVDAMEHEAVGLKSGDKDVEELKHALRRAKDQPAMQATEEYWDALGLLQEVFNLPRAWSLDQILDKVDAVDKWRADTRAAIERSDEEALMRVVLQARREGFARILSEYSTALVALVAASKSKVAVNLEKIPSAWSVQTEAVRCDSRGYNVASMRELESAGGLVQAIQQLVDATSKDIRTRDRRDGSALGKIHVQNVEHIMNLRAWQSYLCSRRQITQKRALKIGGRPLKSIASESILTDAMPAWKLLRTYKPAGGELDRQANECLLWHGTVPAAAWSIAMGDFKVAFAGKASGTMYGKGFYFAESFTKSDEYARSVHDRNGCRAMLLCRCVMGHWLLNTDASPNGSELQRKVVSGEYDSLVGDRRECRGTFREFIVYDSDQVYPAFLVWYKRDSDRR